MPEPQRVWGREVQVSGTYANVCGYSCACVQKKMYVCMCVCYVHYVLIYVHRDGCTSSFHKLLAPPLWSWPSWTLAFCCRFMRSHTDEQANRSNKWLCSVSVPSPKHRQKTSRTDEDRQWQTSADVFARGRNRVCSLAHTCSLLRMNEGMHVCMYM